jgi:signal transduction histidine kinase
MGNGQKIDFEKLFNNCPSSCLVLDVNFNIVAVTDMYLDATMTKRENITGRHLFEVFPDNPNDLAADGETNLKRSLNFILENKQPHKMDIQKYDIRKPGGEFEVRYWSPYNNPVLNDKNEIEYIIHRVEDVTEFIVLKNEEEAHKQENKDLKSLAKQMKSEIIDRTKEIKEVNRKLLHANDDLKYITDELKRSNEELANFAMIASHDIQAPFRIVGQYLELIENKLAGANIQIDLSSYFEKIYAARERISSLLEDLLQISLVSKSEKPFTRVSLQKVIEDVLSNLEAVIRDAGAQVIVREKMPDIMGEEFQMLQIFQNLITNGIKFNRSKPPIVEINVIKDEDHYLFSVKDNGVGIDKMYFDKIFEVFQRLNPQREFPGTGLGLAICKRIIEHHKGKLWVESKPNEGATFYFTIPVSLN